jgi:EAL domain-containing protein (putative c-di-GMP-specific phosphodiesterase class I)/ActR/RegA family two-component response regulator
MRPDEPRLGRSSSATESLAGSERLHVLVVDDDEAILSSLSRLLGSNGIPVMTASDGDRALAVLQAHSASIGVIVADYAMPCMNGMELLQRVRARWPDITLVLLTGRADLPLAAQAVNQLHVARLFLKPWNPLELRAEVAGLVAQATLFKAATTEGAGDESPTADLSLLGELRTGLRRNQLRLVYQPVVRVSDGKMVGVEALARWQHPDRGLLGPEHFIALAEQNGLIQALTEMVVGVALDQCQAWRSAGIGLFVSVNLSMRNMGDPDLPSMILRLLSANGLPPELLLVELTETAMMADLARTLEVLAYLRSLGVKVAIDDFGTGQSSLARLKLLPVDVVKLDKSFVSHLTTDPRDLAVARMSVALGHDLGLRVLAEGVEDEPTWDALGRLGCDLAQGYFLGRPMSAAQLTQRVSPDVQLGAA